MKVSVAIITYNHDKFIAQAIDGVLMQDVDFEYEIVIGEDASTDNTRSILRAYEKLHPEKIRVFFHEKNIGPEQNFTEIINACRGEYIASFDGDDFWTSPCKLQRQADFLDNHPECSMCFHGSKKLYEDGSERHYYPPGRKALYSLEDLLHHNNFISSCTTMVRRGLFVRFPPNRTRESPGDWIYHLVVAEHGHIGYIDEVMAVYRVHHGGTWSSLDAMKRHELLIENSKLVDAVFDFRYTKIIRRGIAGMYLAMAALYAERGIRRGAFQYLLKGIRTSVVGAGMAYTRIILVFLRLYLPSWLEPQLKKLFASR